jgi:hypothetical protein
VYSNTLARESTTVPVANTGMYSKVQKKRNEKKIMRSKKSPPKTKNITKQNKTTKFKI